MPALWMTGCEVKNDYIFEDISTHRITEYIEACDAVLEEAPSGWKFVYYPDTSQYGGYTFLMKFKENNRVEMQWDGSDEVTESAYSFNASQGPVLSFDTYSLLHLLSDPNPAAAGGKAGLGYKGEFEFVIDRVAESGDTVYLHTKNGKLPVFIAHATETDWNRLDECQAVVRNFQIDYESDTKFYRYLELNGQAALIFYSLKLRMAYFAYPESGAKTVAMKLPWALTPDGIRFNRPVTFAGVTFSGLTATEVGEGMQLGLLDASSGHGATFVRADSTREVCRFRFPGSVASSRRTEGFNLIEYGSGMSSMVREAEGYGSQDFRFYWNFSGQAAGEVYLQTAGGVAKYAGLYVTNVADIPNVDTDDRIDYSTGDQVVFTIADAAGRTVVSGAVNNDDNMWFMRYYRYDLLNNGLMGRHFLDTKGFTVIDFGGQFVMVRNSDNRAWGLYSPKEGRN